MTILILRRHAHIEEASPRAFSRRAEIPLTPLRMRQANALAKRLSRLCVPLQAVALYLSPMGRSLATAAPPISQALNIRSRTLSNLQDLDYGEWQVMTQEAALPKSPALCETWKKRPPLIRFPRRGVALGARAADCGRITSGIGAIPR